MQHRVLCGLVWAIVGATACGSTSSDVEPTTDAGTSPDSSTGATAAKDASGVTGETGASDASGATGPTGPTGAQDASGTTGTADASGGTGAKDASGTTGTTDASGGAGAKDASGTTGTTDAGGAGAKDASGTTADTGASGGTDAGGGGGLTPAQVVKVMPPGWNLGNSFDGDPNVTSFGNPTPNQTLINAVHAAGFNTLRLPVTWTDHIGAAPGYTVDAAWMAQVVQTAQWAVDAGMYVFVNTHHDADGQWLTFPETTTAAATVAAEVTAVWTQIATAFKSFDSHLMFECFNEPHNTSGNDAMTYTDLNTYLEACVGAIRGTGGANASRIVMIQPVGASPNLTGIQSMQKATIINDPNLLISLHTYFPTNFGLSETPYPWGSSADYTNMQNSISQQIRVWLPTQPIVIGEWGSEGAQATANRAAHALAYSQDVTTAGMVPVWWDNGGSGNGSYALFNRTTGAQTMPTIISGIMQGVKNGQTASDDWSTLANP